MTEKEFCRWLQGHFELNPTCTTLTEDQVIMIREHLQLVFIKVTSPQDITSSTGTMLDKYLKSGTEVSFC